MMTDEMAAHPRQAPFAYVKYYYENRIRRRKRFPEATSFYEAQLGHVRGERIVNVGCGPQLYDDLRHLANAPREYVGLDLNRETFNFLTRSRNRELLKMKSYAESVGTTTRYMHGDILSDSFELENFDCIFSVGFLGIFMEEDFTRAVKRIGGWLNTHGRLVNVGWFGNQQEPEVLRDRVRYQFNNPNNPRPEDIVHWTLRNGFRLVAESSFDVPDKKAYGWEVIHASVFEKQHG